MPIKFATRRNNRNSIGEKEEVAGNSADTQSVSCCIAMNVRDSIDKPRKASHKIGEESKMSKVDAENNDMSN